MKLIKENIPFTMVANEVLYNKNLSFKTKGLYAYLFSKPDTWDFSSSRMVLETKDSRDSIMVMLRELEEAGYLMRKRLSTGKVEYTLIFSHNSLSREIPLGVEKPKSEIAYVAKSLRGESLPISNIYTESNKEEKVKLNSEETSQVNPLIELFKEVNPSYSKLFANKTQRGSAERLLKTHGLEKLSSLIKLLPQMNQDRYAPVITTPVQLEDKFGQLIAYGQRKQANSPLMI